MKVPRKTLIAMHVATLLLALVVITLELRILGGTPEQRLMPCPTCAVPAAPPSRITNT